MVAVAIERTSASCAVETQHLMLHAMGLVAFDCALNGLGPIEVEEFFMRLAREVARTCSRPAHQAATARLGHLRAEGVLS